MRNFLKRRSVAFICKQIVAATMVLSCIILGVIVVLGILAIIFTKEKNIDLPAHNGKVEYHANQQVKKAIKQAESPVDKKETTLPAKKDFNAYELLTPRMKEKVRLKVLRDFAKHPEKYRIEDGTIHLR